MPIGSNLRSQGGGGRNLKGVTDYASTLSLVQRSLFGLAFSRGAGNGINAKPNGGPSLLSSVDRGGYYSSIGRGNVITISDRTPNDRSGF